MELWVEVKDVQKRLGVARTAKGYETSDIVDQLTEAQEEVHSELASVFSSDVLNAWTSTTAPKTAKNAVADLAAAKFFANIYGEPITDKTTRAASYHFLAYDNIKKLKKKQKEALDSAGESVAHAKDTIYSTTSSRTKVFTRTHPDDTDAGEGSLDNF